MKIPANEIHIFQSTLEKTSAEIKNSETILSNDELTKAYRYKFEADKNNYVVCRALLRSVLSEYLSIPAAHITFFYSEKGKPYINNSSIKFNLAHSNNYTVFAFVFEEEVGIDIEYQRELRDALTIAKRYFSKSEVEEFENINSEKIKNAFFYCWTRKEAFLKAVGEGLSYPLADFSVTLKPGNPKIMWIKKKPDEIKKWSLHDIKVRENYISSLAIKSNDMKIIYKQIVPSKTFS
ncbi:MAG: 4'-phosphopantetheinyl transferase superfamily protein [Bacteroidota bacterium]|nr:4'-phosphopantetheinyl transferase superfamily protein [Bacteroidota bacterium]